MSRNRIAIASLAVTVLPALLMGGCHTPAEGTAAEAYRPASERYATAAPEDEAGPDATARPAGTPAGPDTAGATADRPRDADRPAAPSPPAGLDGRDARIAAIEGRLRELEEENDRLRAGGPAGRPDDGPGSLLASPGALVAGRAAGGDGQIPVGEEGPRTVPPRTDGDGGPPRSDWEISRELVRDDLDRAIRQYRAGRHDLMQAELSYKIDAGMNVVKFFHMQANGTPIDFNALTQRDRLAFRSFQRDAEELRPLLKDYLELYAGPSDDDLEELSRLQEEIEVVIRQDPPGTGNALLDLIHQLREFGEAGAPAE